MSNNNKSYASCPARMDDGRHFTDYRPNCFVNNLIQSQNSITDSYKYRMFLQENASKLMELNRLYARIPEDFNPEAELQLRIIRGIKKQLEMIQNFVELEEDGIQ